MVTQKTSPTFWVLTLSVFGSFGFAVHQAAANPPVSPPLNDSPFPHQMILEANGTLEAGDRIAYQDGSLYDEYEIDGREGQQVNIRLESDEFDPYLIVLDPNGDILAQNDDISADNYNAAIDVVLPMDGTYRIITNGFDRHSRGDYRLTVLTPLLEVEADSTDEWLNPLKKSDCLEGKIQTFAQPSAFAGKCSPPSTNGAIALRIK